MSPCSSLIHICSLLYACCNIRNKYTSCGTDVIMMFLMVSIIAVDLMILFDENCLHNNLVLGEGEL